METLQPQPVVTPPMPPMPAPPMAPVPPAHAPVLEGAVPGPSAPAPAPDAAETDSVAGDLDEVAMIDDIHVSEEIVLDENDPPPETDDDDGDFDDGNSSVAPSEMDDREDPLVALEPPAEDHSVQQLTAHTDAVFAVAVNGARPEVLATGGGDDTAFLWRAGEAAPVHRLEGHTDTISSMGFSADGTMLATGALDGTVRVWDAATGAIVAALEGPTQGIVWIAWHARGAVLLAGSEDATAWMWKLPEGTVSDAARTHAGFRRRCRHERCDSSATRLRRAIPAAAAAVPAAALSTCHLPRS
eukprot:7063225-Prymnesium_polylepis.2